MGEKRDDPGPSAPPGAADRRIFRIPHRGKLFELLFGFRFCRRRVDRLQIPGHFLTLLPANIIQRVPYHVHDTQLHFRLWKDRFNRFRKAFEPVDAGNENVRNTSILQLRNYLQPELRTFRFGYPQPQHFLQSVHIDANCQINRFVHDMPRVPHLELDPGPDT